ncbi:MAG: YdcF family protein [Gemmatimonadaceae bacterium]|nr:YdcF family protein [Gemmatimonadaceae bacterium]
MAPIARFRQSAELPSQGALVALLILAAAWLIGIPEALGVARPATIPVVLVLGLLLGRWALRWLYVVLAIVAVLVAVAAWTPVVPQLAAPFVRSDRVNLDSVDAVFVFSGTVNSRGLVMGEALDRLLTGIALRARRPALPLVVSNVRADERSTAAASAADQRALIALVPASGPVEWIDSVASTRDEAVRLTRRAFQARWRRVAVVTSPMHSRRACATVETLGLAVTCVVAPWRPSGWPARAPAERLLVMRRLTYETLAWIQYRVTGWAHWS